MNPSKNELRKKEMLNLCILVKLLKLLNIFLE